MIYVLTIFTIILTIYVIRQNAILDRRLNRLAKLMRGLTVEVRDYKRSNDDIDVEV